MISNSASSIFCRVGLVVFLTIQFAEAAPNLDQSDITKPDFFPILPWDPYHGWGVPVIERGRENGLESIAECNFNMAGFVLPRDLKRCRQLDLGALMLPVDNTRSNFNYFTEWRKMSDEQIDRRVKDMVSASAGNPAVKGYFITDEPGAPDFPALAKAVAAVKKYAPGKIAYINLFPDYATLGAPDISQLGTASYNEYLERFVKEVNPQLLSYDNYMVQYSMDLKDHGTAASYFRNLLSVRAVAQEHHLPCLNIVASCQIRPDAPAPSPANLLLQTYTTLAAGYRGVTWYTYYEDGYHYAPIDNVGKKTLTWAYLKEANRQVLALAPLMSRLGSTGVFFSAPAPADGLPLLPGAIVESVTSATPLMIGEFKDRDGKNYTMMVNLSLEASTRFTLNTKDSQAIKIVSAMDGSLSDYDAKAGLWLPAGQGVLLSVGK